MLKDFAIIAPISSDKDYPNYKKIITKLEKESLSYVKKLNELTNKKALSLEKYLTQKLIQKNAANFKAIYKGFR